MKIKRIKNVKIGEINWSVNWSKEEGGGSFSFSKRRITIGAKNQTELQIFMIVLHEVKEIIQELQSVRYARTDVTGDYLFSYDHRHHTDFCSQLACALDYFIK